MIGGSATPSEGTVSSDRPRARRDLSLQEVGDEGLPYDREAGMVHILNRTALFTWKRCDGSCTNAAIAEALHSAFAGADSVDIARDVPQILASFAERGLLEEA